MAFPQQTSHVDQDTKQIVTGYIRHIEHQLLNEHDDDSFYHIPSAISIMCITYVHNYFMHHSSYKWTINKQNILDSVLNCAVGRRFYSPSFDIATLKWIIEIFPNGDKEKRKGSFIINLKLLTLPSKWKHIIICRTMAFLPLNNRRTTIRMYKKGTSHGWRSKTLSFDEIKQYNFSNLTFIVTVKILKIASNKHAITNNIFYQAPVHLYRRQSHMRWNVDTALLTHETDDNQIADPLYNKCYQSDIFDEMWCLQFCPRETENCIYVQLCVLPPDIAKVQVQYTISFEGTDIKSTLLSVFDYTSSAFGWKIRKQRFLDLKHSVLKDMKRISIICEIAIVNAYDEEGSLITLTEMKWMQYKKRISTQNNEYNNMESLVHQNMELRKRLNAMELKMNEIQHNIDEKCTNIHEENIGLKDWLKNTVKLEQYFDVFIDNGFDDLSTLRFISNSDLEQIGITKLGHRKRLLHYLARV